MMRNATVTRPTVCFVGEVEHPDFAAAASLVHASADVGTESPELIVVAQSRPGAVSEREFRRLRRNAPLAGLLSLLGSWCEGETRTGQPPAGVERLYWYEFPSWWRQQLGLWSTGCCPDWARPGDELRGTRSAGQAALSGRVAIQSAHWDTVAAIADVLSKAGAESVWIRPGQEADLSGTTFGIWEGGQLDDGETGRLSAFCAQLAANNAPVIALLDFPRRDRCEAARHAGAAAVLGKPWRNIDLIDSLRAIKRTAPSATCAA
jgi:hypothetical protein